MSPILDYLKVFAIGGAICVIGQLVISKTSLTPAKLLVFMVVAGVFLTALGLYEPIVKFAKAGATVPLPGFGYALAKGAIDGAAENGVLGALSGGMIKTAPGVAAAILFGYVTAIIFTPKTKK